MVIFYGVEDIITRNPIWRIFDFIRRITPQFCSVQQIAAQPSAGDSKARGNVIIFCFWYFAL